MKSLLILSTFIIQLTVYGVTDIKNFTDKYLSDDAVKKIAIEKNILPEDSSKIDITKEFEEGNVLTIWIISSRTEKVLAINTLKDRFDQIGVRIKNPSEYYVDEINGIIYKSLKDNSNEIKNRNSIRTMFETLAIQEGDYDNGKTKVETLKDFLGKERFERYKQLYPEKFNYLVEKDNK